MEKATLQPGDRVGHYVVERQVAVGGSAVVYQARDPKARRNVAVKVLAAHGTAGVHGGRRLLHEARSYTRLVHPRIVTLYEVGELDGVPYLVMEWVDGVTLAERLESGALEERECVRVMAQIADGLSAAHALGLAHRDIKPANIMLTPNGDVKLLDFGLAKQLGIEMPKSWVTTDGTLLGTPAYMSPEQAHGQPLTLASDVFSFGAVLVEAATGRPAFGRTTTLETLNAVTRVEVGTLPRRRSRIGRGLARLAARCLRRRPEDRPQDARELVAELRRLQDGHLSSRGGSPRQWLATAVAAVLVGLVSVAATVAMLGFGGDDPSPQQGARAIRTGGNCPVISSDGGSYVFCSDDNREIWRAPIDSGRQTRIWRGSETISGLCLSPDDRQALFVTGENAGSPWIWEVPVDSGVPRKIARGFSPAVAPDGAHIAALVELDGGVRQLFVCRRDGTRRRTVAVFDGSRRPLSCAYVSDGSIALVLTDGVHWSRLVKVDVESGATEQITEVQGVALPGLALLPRLNAALWCLRPIASAPSMLWATHLDDGSTSPVYPGPGVVSHISATETGVRLLLGVKDRQVDLVEISVDPGSMAPASIIRPIAGTSGAGQPRVSPDGARLAYQSSFGNLWLMDRTTGDSGPLLTTGTASFNPSWSPDGRFVAYACITDGASALWRAGADGGEPRQITRGEQNDFQPVWHPDGRNMFFVSDRDGVEDLYGLELATGRVRRLGFDGASNPAISPDGSMVAYVVPSFSDGDLLRVATAGEDAERLETAWDHPILLNRWAGGKPRFSPDGRYIAFDQPSGTVGADVWALPVDRGGDAQPIRLTAFESPTSLLSWFDWSSDGELVVALTRDPERFILLDDADRWIERALR
jgi:Tol biopolymer transport system component/tRNA A-37 threonylcarbamoyl transferase component Bud32